MPLSDDPQKRAAQLANLRPNPDNLVPGAGASRPGEARRLVHGARTTSPQRSPLWPPAVRDAVADLTKHVGDELRDDQGELVPWAVPSVEALAVLRVAVFRLARWTDERADRGEYVGDDDDRLTKVTERYQRALEREALTLRSRIEAQGAVHDVALRWAKQSREDERG